MLHLKKFRPTGLAALLIFLAAVTASALQLGSRPAKEWIPLLESQQRVSGLKIDEIIARLNLKPGMVVAEIGSGSGLFSRPLAGAVAPDGTVYSVDIDKELLAYVDMRAKEANIKNIKTVFGDIDDPKLPGPVADLAFFHDVLHHVAHRAQYLKALAKYIKPGGRIAVVENDIHDPTTTHREQPEMLVAREDADKWMADAGFSPVEEFDLFPGKKWFVIYGRK